MNLHIIIFDIKHIERGFIVNSCQPLIQLGIHLRYILFFHTKKDCKNIFTVPVVSLYYLAFTLAGKSVTVFDVPKFTI